eukprot:gnl/TRDRNA2_/TRDRNA2_161228_c1_seq1.p1 gnl/TRDRNA2_/TRDRNA2_161228_c1~~gnl/TRDRNA2_/TRDRNA2_161228_c1_seq1.p1  ORF type:complete len:703 (-),score=142.22 gnl/TRDRNA2_/TRDRNA2_161228_c1_seq1:95-1999(-)
MYRPPAHQAVAPLAADDADRKDPMHVRDRLAGCGPIHSTLNSGRPRGTSWADMVSDDSESGDDCRGGTPPAAASSAVRPAVPWADMVSDESGSDADGGCRPQSPISTSTSPQAASCTSGSQAVASSGTHKEPSECEPRHSTSRGSQTSPDEFMVTPRTSAETWIEEIQAMADRLRSMTESAPSANTETSFGGAATALAPVDTDRQKALSISKMNELQQQAASLEEEVAGLEEAAIEAELQCSAFVAEVQTAAAHAAALVAASEQEHQQLTALTAETSEILSAAKFVACAAAEEVQKGSVEREEQIATLRRKQITEARAADEAKAEAGTRVASRERAQDLPAIKAEIRASKLRTVQAEKESAQHRKRAEDLRADLDAATNNARVRTSALEARISQLECECQSLQATGGVASENTAVSACNNSPSDSVQQELIAAQERNRSLVAEVRDVRALRDAVVNEHAGLVMDIKAARSQYHCNCRDRDDFDMQLQDFKDRDSSIKAEVEKWRCQIEELEQQAQSAEAVAVERRQRQSEVETTFRSLLAARRKHEENTAVLESRYQKFIAMVKEKSQPSIGWPSASSASVSRTKWCLGPGIGLTAGSATGTKQHKLRCGSSADADADAEVSTTAGESAAEGIP